MPEIVSVTVAGLAGSVSFRCAVGAADTASIRIAIVAAMWVLTIASEFTPLWPLELCCVRGRASPPRSAHLDYDVGVMAIVKDPEQHETRALSRMVASLSALRVLEIGCGDGRLTRRYAGQARSVIAIDPKPDAIRSLADELPEVDARAIGIDQLDLPPGSVDVAIFSWSL